jgi:hypothetical protein
MVDFWLVRERISHGDPLRESILRLDVDRHLIKPGLSAISAMPANSSS